MIILLHPLFNPNPNPLTHVISPPPFCILSQPPFTLSHPWSSCCATAAILSVLLMRLLLLNLPFPTLPQPPFTYRSLKICSPHFFMKDQAICKVKIQHSQLDSLLPLDAKVDSYFWFTNAINTKYYLKLFYYYIK